MHILFLLTLDISDHEMNEIVRKIKESTTFFY